MYGGIHAIDRLLWLLATRVTSVSARWHHTYGDGDVEDGLVAMLDLANGATAVLFENSPPFGRPGGWCTELFGSAGAVRIQTGEWVELTAKTRRLRAESLDDLHFQREIDEFASSVLEGRAPSVPATAGRDSLEVALAIYRSAADGTYRLSMRLFELAHRQPQTKRLVAVALPLMNELGQVTRQSSHLVTHHDRRILVVAQVDSPEAMGFSVRIGAHFPFRVDRVSALTLTAFQSFSAQQEMVRELIENDPGAPARSSVMRMVNAIARRGYMQHRSATLPGITDICCPVLDRSGSAVATLTQPWLRQRYVDVTVAQARAAQLDVVARISRGLGREAPA
jgi:DNA-binding IclR family transcriptional regulator